MSSTHDAYGQIEQLFGHVSNRTRLLVFSLIIAAQFALIVNSSWRATPDSALYLGLGESIAAGKGYTFNGEPHTFVPPGYPLLVAAARLLSHDNFLNYRVLMALIGFLTAVMGYVFFRRLCGPNTALFLGGLFGVNHVLLYNSTLTLSDAPFALFTLFAVTALVVTAEKKFPLPLVMGAALLTGLPALIRINGLGIPIAGGFFVFFSMRDSSLLRRFIYCALFVLIALAPTLVWQQYKATFPVSFGEGTYYDAVAGRTFLDSVRAVIDSVIGYGSEMSFALTGVVVRMYSLEFIIPIVVVSGAILAFRNGDRLLTPLVVVQFGGLLLTAAGARYLIMITPFLYLFFLTGLVEILKWMKSSRNLTVDEAVVARWVLSVFIALNVGHNLITIAQCRTALEAGGAQSERSLPLFTAARWLKVNAPGAKVLTTRTRMIHYLSGCKTIPLQRSGVSPQDTFVSDEALIHKLLNKHSPELLFTDSKAASFTNIVLKAVESAGWKTEKTPDASEGTRYTLYRLISKP